MKTILIILGLIITLNVKSQTNKESYNRAVDSMVTVMKQEKIQYDQMYKKTLLSWEKTAITNMQLLSNNAYLERDKTRLIAILRNTKGVNQKEIDNILK